MKAGFQRSTTSKCHRYGPLTGSKWPTFWLTMCLANQACPFDFEVLNCIEILVRRTHLVR
jgi:hypothetical protein